MPKDIPVHCFYLFHYLKRRDAEAFVGTEFCCQSLEGSAGGVLEAPHTARLAEAALAKTLGALSWGP